MTAPNWRQQLKTFVGPRWTTRLRCWRRGLPVPRWGNLRRLTPFSDHFGFDRGTPVDRPYLHRFLESNRAAIAGDVLEIQMAAYGLRYGSAVRTLHTLDIDPRHQPTYLCDLANSAGVVPDSSYDCFLLPNTLSYLRNLEDSLRHALRILRPGGTILAAGSCLSPAVDTADDLWRLHAASYRVLLDRVWPGCEIEVESFGNCLTAVASIMGIAAEELTEAELWHRDPRFPVATMIRCRKPR